MEYAKLYDRFNFTDFVIRNYASLVLFGIVFWISSRILKSWNAKRPPGPVGLPFVGYLPFLGKEHCKTLWDLRKKYGDIMGLYLGPHYTIVLNEYNLAKEVLSHPAALTRPSNILNHIPNPGFGTENGEIWVEQRKFSRFAIRDVSFSEGVWENLIMEEVFSFVDEIRSTKGEATDIYHSLSASMISNILSILIGRRLNKEEEADKVKLVVDYADVAVLGASSSNPTTVIPGFRKFCEIFKINGYHRIHKTIQSFAKFISDEVNRQRTSTSLKYADDFINTYLNKLSDLKKSGSKNHYFTEDRLEGNVNAFFLGGTDTVISSLCWLLRLMAKHKDIQKKVYVELMEVTGYEGRARYRERQNIPYTFAVIAEQQRFSSIVPLSTTRKLTQDIKIGGFKIPKGSHVTANLWGLHHDPTYWENPEEFRPERFFTDNNDTKLIAQPQSYFPFSVGRRNCPGENIAWMEILFYFSEIVKNFEISFVPGVEPKFDIIGGLVTRLVDQPLCFTERKRNV